MSDCVLSSHPFWCMLYCLRIKLVCFTIDFYKEHIRRTDKKKKSATQCHTAPAHPAETLPMKLSLIDTVSQSPLFLFQGLLASYLQSPAQPWKGQNDMVPAPRTGPAGKDLHKCQWLLWARGLFV